MVSQSPGRAQPRAAAACLCSAGTRTPGWLDTHGAGVPSCQKTCPSGEWGFLRATFRLLNLPALSQNKWMCQRSKRSQSWGVTDCCLCCCFRKTCHLNVIKLNLTLLSCRITFTISTAQTSTGKLPWTTSVRDLPLWRQHLTCPGALKQGICISGFEGLSFLYVPKENKTCLLHPNPCHPPNQTLQLNCLAQPDFKH